MPEEMSDPPRFANLDTDELRRKLGVQQENCNLLCRYFSLTPLLKSELEAASRMLEILKDIKSSEIEMARSAARDLVDRLYDHWTKLYTNPVDVGWLFSNMSDMQAFLRQALLCDYAKIACSQVPLIRSFAQFRVSPEERYRNIYQNRVVPLLEEMMLNREFVETKLDTLINWLTYHSPIPGLITDCRWEDLANTISKDRALATRLQQQNVFTNYDWALIREGMEKTQKEYFDDLVDAKHFRLSRKAQKLTAKRNTDPTPPSYSLLFGSGAT